MSFRQTKVSGFPAVALRSAEVELVAVPAFVALVALSALVAWSALAALGTLPSVPSLMSVPVSDSSPTSRLFTEPFLMSLPPTVPFRMSLPRIVLFTMSPELTVFVPGSAIAVPERAASSATKATAYCSQKSRA